MKHVVMRPAGAPFPNCHNLGSSGISAYLHELCTHLSPSPPPFLDIGQISLTQSVKLGGPSQPAPQLLRTKQLLVSSLPPVVLVLAPLTDAPQIQSCTCSSHAESTCPDYFSSAGEKIFYFLVGNFCISCWRSVFVCLLEYPLSSPTHVDRPAFYS